ncbi:hypothetical protein EV06_1506 [Prochlorococcus sp. MIT 0602]|nr:MULTISPECIES: hypothetical protein [unclassified Prochlorococcus]KGG14992.1 hypothetical protein EV06_1506 [Prochlorococcus sp. MIT 0602]KGG17169.1 hypothetical protein EV07_0604 [Prochlorococcus sp. MIT 0603]
MTSSIFLSKRLGQVEVRGIESSYLHLGRLQVGNDLVQSFA